ncbi:hypothetical protein N7474_002780 [Penicillium riverlandense]|uniref:uncharacterized protein n=1 Tax=Penicillium riverlandense TaxID=1903569 RepID=UPI00254772D5|nr:uncharacterized protein N7474_002780 [Penicillium riverlandense]KAJ5825642.1 hypothetical protein N7474_002780 [Penicillium riverlandense]
MSTFPTPLPVVLCGKTTKIGKPVSQLLQPEYEGSYKSHNGPTVIHFIQSFEAAKAELPLLLAGRDPQVSEVNDEGVGTHNYSQPPRAVILGRAFDEDQVQELRQACAGASPAPVAWLLGDPAKAPTVMPGPDYAVTVTNDCKSVLAKWKEAGGVNEDIILF